MERAAQSLHPGMQILDVGSGRRPTLGPELRPDGVEYAGLDISSEELGAAPPGAYNRAIVGDVTQQIPGLEDRFDLIVSWQVLEHVASLESALANLRSYLHPGGRLVAQLSGSFALFAFAARLMPHPLRASVMTHLIGADPGTKFPTHYDHCYYSALERLLSPWSAYEIVPRYNGAVYFSFCRPLESAYLAYEDWACRSRRRNLATHYIVVAQK